MSRFSPNPKYTSNSYAISSVNNGYYMYRVMCSTINAVPETQSLLSKLKLPLGIHIHPYQSLTMQVCS